MRISVILTFVILITMASSQHVWASKFYKWVDAEGATHYTENPPPGETGAEVGVVKTIGIRSTSNEESDESDEFDDTDEPEESVEASANTESGAEESSSNSEENEEQGDEGEGEGEGDSSGNISSTDKEKVAKRCEHLQKNLDLLQSKKRIKLKNKDGTSAYLDEEGISKHLSETQEQLKDCQKES